MEKRTDLIADIADRVCERLMSRRIGFLWSGVRADLPEAAGYTWVHYTRGESGLRIYDLEKISAPMREGTTLSMLVVPNGPVSLVAEVFAGIPSSRSAQLLCGCIAAPTPALYETSRLAAWYASAEERERKNLLAAVACLEGMGVSFFGPRIDGLCKQIAAGENTRSRGAIAITERGWYAWSDVAAILERGDMNVCEKIILSPGARLTPEAVERLRLKKIEIAEGM